MNTRLPLLALLLLFTGCVAHVKSEKFVSAQPQQAFAGNKKVTVFIIPTVKLTKHRNLPERLSAAAFFHSLDTGPYALGISVQSNGIENGVPVEVTSASLCFSSGLATDVMPKNSPSLKGVTQQQEKQSKYVERDNFSRCDFTIPLGDRLVFKTKETLHVVVTVKIGGLADEVKLDAEFTGAEDEHWGSTLSLL